jgi:DNA-directed RNA polymerase subunit beta
MARLTFCRALTCKSDDVAAFQDYETIVKACELRAGFPESFNVLVRELQSLCLDVGLIRARDRS